MHPPKGMRGVLQKYCKPMQQGLSFILSTHITSFSIEQGIRNVYGHTCTTHPCRFVCVYIYIYLYKKRETYKLLTAAYSCNSFCLMALLGFLIVMTNWLPSNAEMGKASWSCRRNMRTYLTMCKGTQGLFSGAFCLFVFRLLFLLFCFFLRGRAGKEAWSETM